MNNTKLQKSQLNQKYEGLRFFFFNLSSVFAKKL